MALLPACRLKSETLRSDGTSAESIPTLKNRELIHFGFLLRGFVEKESTHDT